MAIARREDNGFVFVRDGRRRSCTLRAVIDWSLALALSGSLLVHYARWNMVQLADHQRDAAMAKLAVAQDNELAYRKRLSDALAVHRWTNAAIFTGMLAEIASRHPDDLSYVQAVRDAADEMVAAAKVRQEIEHGRLEPGATGEREADGRAPEP